MQRDVKNNNVFNDPNYYHYLIQFIGDIKAEIDPHPYFVVTILSDIYAILSFPKEHIDDIDQGLKFKTVVFVKPFEMYTLQSITPAEAAQAEFLQLNLPLNLTGHGVDVAIIDTGIDYLNEEFMDREGNSRINFIWDQTAEKREIDFPVDAQFGTVYSHDEIQSAINEYRNGNDPYRIVPSKDEIGHGTQMAGLIGGTGKRPELKGIAPDCNLMCVKLVEDYGFESSFKPSVPVYNLTSLWAAILFLYRYSSVYNRPLVIYMPLGTNLGNHKGNGVLDSLIDYVSMNSRIIVVTCAGNERAANNHASGAVSADENSKTIEIDVPPEEKYLWVEIWVDAPNIMSVEVISPSGEDSGISASTTDKTSIYQFIFEKTKIKLNYYIPEQLSGDELIKIRFYDLQPGIWKIRLTGDVILDGGFNIWIPQQGITSENTVLSPSDTYGTLINPSNNDFSVTAAAYNQNNNNVVGYSGMAFSENYINAIDVAAGGVDVLTTAPGNKTAIANGTSVSAAIVAGACAMLFEWGVIQRNDPYMYSKTIKTYLARSVIARGGDYYPNAQWGYGILNILNMFQNLT